MRFPIPQLFVRAAGRTEFFEGLLLASGLLAKPSAFFIIMITMAVAGFVRHADDPFSTKETGVC